MKFLPVDRRDGIPSAQAKDMLQAGWRPATGIAVQVPGGIATPDNPNPPTQASAIDLWYSPQENMVPAGTLARAIYETMKDEENEDKVAIINELCEGLFGQSLETIQANFEKVLNDGNADGNSIQERSRRAYAMGDTRATDPEQGEGDSKDAAPGDDPGL